jgi:hypothetical protein
MPEATLAIYDDKTKLKPEQTIVIPESIELPDMRYAFPSGTLEKDDIIVVSFMVMDKTGREKTLDVPMFKVQLEEYPSDSKQEILAVAYLNFVIANKGMQEAEMIEAVLKDEEIIKG